MPSTGTRSALQRRSSSQSGKGASFSCTLAGPPLRITALGLCASTRPASAVPASATEYTPSSLALLAINCVYCEPKSRTTSSASAMFAFALLLRYRAFSNVVSSTSTLFMPTSKAASPSTVPSCTIRLRTHTQRCVDQHRYVISSSQCDFIFFTMAFAPP